MDDSSYAVHIDAPDISPWRAGNTGVEFVTSLDSARPGPHVLVTAVVHGNELCGAIVLDRLLREQISAAKTFHPGRRTAARKPPPSRFASVISPPCA